jgi:N-acetylglucosamine kinase-like BadF-type ATPase
VLAGTGTVAVGESGGKRIFAGGWGPDLDDAGSGGRIGKEALSAVLLSIDGRIGKTSLRSIFVKFIKPGVFDDFNIRMELKKNVTALSRKELAALAPDVYRHFLHGDEMAAEIIRNAARGIALLANAVAVKNASGSEIRVMALGGIFKLGTEFRDLCEEYLSEIRDDVKFVFPGEFDLSRGACIMVLMYAGVDIDERIMESIRKKGDQN